jgi:hypothetical protein
MCVYVAINAMYFARLEIFPAVFVNVFWGITSSRQVFISSSLFFLEYLSTEQRTFSGL